MAALHRGLRILILVFASFAGNVNASPQEREEPSYQRVFVPRSDLSPLVPQDFVPVDTKELEQLLGSRSAKSEPSITTTTPIPSQLILVANLVGEDLVSDLSRISIDYQGHGEADFVLQPVSMALRPSMPGVLREDRTNAFSTIHYGKNGLPQCRISESTQIWFGWSQRALEERRSRSLDYELSVPRTMLSRLFLRLPPSWTVSSERAPIRRMERIDESLPSDWPELSTNGNRDVDNWWEVLFSGSSQVRIRLSRQEETKIESFSHVIGFQKNEYRIANSGMGYSSEWTIHPSSNLTDPWQIEIEPRLRVTSLQCDGMEVDWEQKGNGLTVDWSTVPTKDLSQTRWSLQANMEWNTDRVPSISNPILPFAQLANSYVRKGETKVTIVPPLVPKRVWTERGTVASPSTTIGTESELVWATQWTGRSDEWIVVTDHLPPKPNLKSLSVLNPQAEAILASSIIELKPGSLPISLLEFTLGTGWTMESLVSTDPKISLQWKVLSSDEQGTKHQVILSPAAKATFFLELQSRFALSKTDQQKWILPSKRMIVFPGCSQEDTFVVESGNSFSLRPSQDFLVSSIREEELEEWQKSRLPTGEETWLIRTKDGVLPKIELEPQPATYSVEVQSRIRVDAKMLKAQYTLRCTPLSGSLQRIVVDMSTQGAAGCSWSFLDEDQQETNSDDSIDFIRIPSNRAGENRFEIKFGRPRSDSFVLKGLLVTPFVESMNVPLPSLPDAYPYQPILLVDSELAIQMQPDDSIHLPSVQDPFFGVHPPRVFATDSTKPISIAIETRNAKNQPLPWIEEERLDHILLPSGHVRHHIHWNCRSMLDGVVRIGYPKNWRLEALLIDGSPSENWRTHTDGSLSIWVTPPQNEAVFELEKNSLFLEFSDREQIRYNRPQLKIERLDPTPAIGRSEERLWLPEGWLIAHADESTPEEFARRWIPWRWRNSLLGESSSGPLRSRAGPSWIEIGFTERWRGLSRSWQPIDLESRTKSLDRDKEEKALEVHLVSVQEQLGWSWGCFLVGLGSVLQVLRWIPKSLGCVIAFPFLFILWVPADWLPLAQASVLGILVGLSVHWLIHAMKRIQVPEHPSTFRVRSSVVRQTQSTKLPALAVTFISLLSMTQPSHGQISSPQAILIPIDPQGNVDGSVAYIHKEFYEHLTLGSRRDSPIRNRLLSARYQLSLGGLSTGSMNYDELIMSFDIEVSSNSEWVRFPLSLSQARFQKMLVNEAEVPLGNRLRWDDSEIAWLPERDGRYRVRLFVVPQQKTVDDTRRILLDVIPVASATLEVLVPPGVVHDLQIQSMGQVLNPASGKHVAHLGPISKIDLRWRRSAQKNDVKEPMRCIGESWIDLRNAKPIAVTTLRIVHWPEDSDWIEIEGPSDWQPLGTLWGDAKYSGAISSNSLAKRRFRLQWRNEFEGVEKKSDVRTIEFMWVADAESLLSIPSLDIVGQRLEQRFVRLIHPPTSPWRIEGNSNWTEIAHRPVPKMLDLSPAENDASYAIQEPATPALLRRLTNARAISVRSHSQVLFSKGHTVFRFQSQWNQIPTQISEIELDFPLHSEIKRIRLNGLPAIWSLPTIEGRRQVVRVFLGSEHGGLQTIDIQAMQSSQVEERKEIPVVRLRNFDEVEHRIVLQTDDRVDVAFQNLASWPEITGNPIPGESEVGARILSYRRLVRSLWKEEEELTSWPSYQTLPQATLKGKLVSRFARVGSSWQFQCRGEFPESKRMNVLLSVPTGILPSLTSVDRIPLASSTNASRTFLKIPLVDQRFQIDGILPIDSSQGFLLPDIQLVEGDEVEHFFVGVLQSNGQQLNFNAVGANKIDDEDMRNAILSFSNETRQAIVFKRMVDQWRIVVDVERPIDPVVQCPIAFFDVDIDSRNQVSIRGRLWIAPTRQKTLRMEAPKGMSIVAASLHGRTVSQIDRSHSVELEGFTNDLPFEIDVIVRGQLSQIEPGMVPMIEGIQWQEVYWNLRNRSPNTSILFDSKMHTMSPSSWRSDSIQNAFDFVMSAANLTSAYDLPFRQGWYLPWRVSLRSFLASASNLVESSKRFDRGLIEDESNPTEIESPDESWSKSVTNLDELDRRFDFHPPSRAPSIQAIETESDGNAFFWKGTPRTGLWASVENRSEQTRLWRMCGISFGIVAVATIGVWLHQRSEKWIPKGRPRPWWSLLGAASLLALFFPWISIGILVAVFAIVSLLQTGLLEWQRTRRLKRT